MHLFSSEPPERTNVTPLTVTPAPSPAGSRANSDDDRLTRLEEAVSRLRTELSDVQQQLAAFRKQFE